MLATWLPISSVALAVWLARFLTSDATTAKPFPDSPARAASIVAFKASKLVCSAMSEINSTTSPIFWADSDSFRTVVAVCCVASSALWVVARDSLTWLLISVIEAESSSAAAATVCTLADACSVAQATAADCWAV